MTRHQRRIFNNPADISPSARKTHITNMPATRATFRIINYQPDRLPYTRPNRSAPPLEATRDYFRPATTVPPPPPPRRQTARRSSPLPLDYEQIVYQLALAIHNRNRPPVRLFTNIMEMDNTDIIDYSLLNIQTLHDQHTQGQYRSYYQIGYVIFTRRDNYPEETDEDIKERFRIPNLTFTRADKTYQFFQS